MSNAKTVKKVIERVKELDEKATDAPWFRWYSGVHTAIPDPRDFACDDPRMLEVSRHADHLPYDSPEGIANAALIAEYRKLAPQLAIALEAVVALHKPEKRWLPWDGADVSYSSAEEAWDEYNYSVDKGYLDESFQNIADRPFFILCSHCKELEDSPDDGESTRELGYRESLYPCKTVGTILNAFSQGGVSFKYILGDSDLDDFDKEIIAFEYPEIDLNQVGDD